MTSFGICEYLICYGVVAITCLGFAAADLMTRFKSGNSVGNILWGIPQGCFYLLVMGAGIFTLFGSETLGNTKIVETVSKSLGLSIMESVGVGIVTFIGLRTTINVLTASEAGKKVEFGPGTLFAALLENIESRIDNDRTVKATKDIKKIAPTLSPRAIFYVVLPYCFDQAEKNVGDRESITSTLKTVYDDKDRNISLRERSALMLIHLHKRFGLAVLESAKELVEQEDAEGWSDANGGGSSGSSGRGTQDDLQLTESQLDSLLNTLQRIER